MSPVIACALVLVALHKPRSSCAPTGTAMHATPASTTIIVPTRSSCFVIQSGSPCLFLPAKHIRKDQRRRNACVTLDNELRRLLSQLAPRNLFVRDRPRVRPVARRRI